MSSAPPPRAKGGLRKHFQRLSLQNEQLRADVVQLRLRAAGAARRVSAPGRGQSAFTSVGTWHQHEAAVSDVCVVGSIVVACSWDASLTSFDLESWNAGPSTVVGTEEPEAEPGGVADGGPLQAVAATRRDSNFTVLAGSEDSRAWLWSMDSGTVQVLKGHEGAINDVDFHPQTASVACTAGDDCKAIIWDTSRCKQVRSLPQHQLGVTSCHLLGASDGAGMVHDRSVVTASADGHVRVWDLRAPTLLYALPVAASRRVTVDANSTSQLLLAASDLGTVSAWDLRTLTRLQHLDVAAQADVHSELTSIALSPCCCYLAVGALDGTLVTLDLRSPVDAAQRNEERIDVRQAHDDAVFGLAWGAAFPWRPDPSPFLVCSSHDGNWSCWMPNSEVREGSSVNTAATAKQWLGAAAAKGMN